MDHAFSNDVLVGGFESGNQFSLALVTGLVMAIICAVTWGVVAFFAGSQLDCLALGVGVLIGVSIRFTGKGTTSIYGLLAVVFTLIASLAGNVFGVIISGAHDNLDIFGVIQKLNLLDTVMSILSQATLMTYVLFAAGAALSFLVAVRR